jgi:hypothetical protein
MVPSCQPELLQHERLIPLLPTLDHAALRETVKYEPIHGNGFAGGWHLTEWSLMGSGCAPAECRPLTRDELILDREVEVWKRREEPSNELLPLANTSKRLRDAGDVNHTIGREGRIGCGHVTSIQSFNPDALVLDNVGQR